MRFLRVAFALDFRSVRVFRVLLGILILIDFLYRIPVLRDLYSDDGVLPRSLWAANGIHAGQVSLFLFSGSVAWAALLFALLALSAFLLILDIEVRLSSVLAFILLLSIHNRNFFAIYGADNLLRMMAIWSIFLPATRGRLQQGAFANMSSAGALLQLAMLYFCTGWLKGNQDWLWHPDATYYAISIEYFATPVGRWLVQYPGVLRVATVLTLLLERFGWILFFSVWQPAWCRMIAFCSFALLHLAICVTLDVGLFPACDLAFLVLLLPPQFWDHLAEHGGQVRQKLIAGFTQVHERRWLPVMACIILVFLLWSNARDFYSEKSIMPPAVAWSARAFGFVQNWRVFAPRPLKLTGWFVGVGIKADGTRVDALNLLETSPSFARPESVIGALPHRAWLPYLIYIAANERKDLRSRFADFLCERWQRSKSESLQRVDFYFMMKFAKPPGEAPVFEPRVLSARLCQNQRD